MLKRSFLFLAILLIAVLGFAMTRPDTFRVERHLLIKAPPEAIYERLQDFRRWSEWSPWEKLDPAMQRRHEGATSGVGAIYSWEGNDKVGVGRMEVTDATPVSRLVIKLDFIKPFEGHNVAEFSLSPGTEGTDVRWAMHGPSPFLSKLMQVFFSMDAMIGKDFEAGLHNLKTATER
jgi:uncharacterized protein YndB with AHSA1/START domain